MSTLGIEVSTTVEPMETDHMIIEGAEEVDGMGHEYACLVFEMTKD